MDNNGRINLFNEFTLDLARGSVLRAGEPVHLRPQTYEVLRYLIENRDHLISKDRLIEEVWKGRAVTDGSLGKCIEELREALGPEAKEYIRNVRGRGYIFDTGVVEQGESVALSATEQIDVVRVTVHEEETVTKLIAPSKLSAVISAPRSQLHLRTATVVIAGLLLVTVALLIIFRPWNSRRTKSSEVNVAGRPSLGSIAVLPFKAIGAEKDNEYLSLGLADALITKLGNAHQIIVRPTSAVRRYTDANQDPVSIGSQQSVDAVLDGSYQRTGDRLRLTVQLIRVADAATLWSAQFDEKFTDIFAVQDSISERVACDLVTHVCGKENAQLAKQKPIKIGAYEAYLKGRYFWNKRTGEGFQKAANYFNQAIQIEPDYAQAYVGLADIVFLSGGDKEAVAKGRAALKKAVEIDETLSEPHATLGLLAMNIDWDWAEAEKEFKRAIELNPNYVTAHHWYGEFLVYMGRFDEAITEIKRAHELDPLSLIISTDVAKVHAMARRYDEAIEQYKRALEIDPQFAEAHGLLAMSYSWKGQHEEAERELLQIEGVEDNPMYLSWLVYVYGMSGRRDKAQRELNRLRDLSKQTYVSPLWMTVAYTGLGEKDEAFKWFERVFEERAAGGAVSLKVNPIWDSLRHDPRFQDLLRRVGLAP